MIRHILSFDVEEYFHSETFRTAVPLCAWNKQESRVEASTDRLLILLEEASVCATFFVLGWVAQRHPSLVRRIADGGHEVASHGYSHDLVYSLSPDTFRQDVMRARCLLEDITGTAVVGYRAPSFSITALNLWAFDVLCESGHQYDSSVFPVRHHRYGIPGFSRRPVRIQWASGETLDEYPMATIGMRLLPLPVAGGGYFRLLPEQILRRAWDHLTESAHGSVFYLHPWELDPGQPWIRVGALDNIRHYSGLRSTEGRLRRWLGAYEWLAFRDWRTDGEVTVTSRDSLDSMAR
jgi:polysaccharide deacetylase family protein (PEP-CTERM system associated)